MDTDVSWASQDAAHSPQEGQTHRPVTIVWTIAGTEPALPCTVVQGVYHPHSHESYPSPQPRDMQSTIVCRSLGCRYKCEGRSRQAHICLDSGLASRRWGTFGLGGCLESARLGGAWDRKGHTRGRVSHVQPFGDHLHHFCRIPDTPALLLNIYFQSILPF